MLESDDMLVVHRPVDLDLTHQFLLGPALGQGGLLHDLGSQEYLCVLVYDFIALGKASLAKELASQVLLDLYLTVVLNDLLFYGDLLNWFHCLRAVVRMGSKNLLEWLLAEVRE